MANWASLPAEIRIMILDLILLSGNARGNMTACALVSREWQTFFEPENFRRLVLNHSCIADFEEIVRHRRWMVKHIWLRVELPRYRCYMCGTPEPPAQSRRNNQIFTNALWQLLRILGSWGDTRAYDPVNGTAPVLELSAHSPSDMKHHFDACALDKDIYPHSFDEKCTDEDYSAHLLRELSKDPKRGVHCRLLRRSQITGTLRYHTFGEIELDFSAIEDLRERKLPSVNAIKGLFIRRQHYRGFSPQTVAEVTRSFKTIDNFIFEPILRNGFGANVEYQREYKDLVREAHRFKSLSIFVGHHCTSSHPWPYVGSSGPLSSMLADESYSLEHLSVAFAGDAVVFFEDFLQPSSNRFRKYLDPSRSGVQRALLASLSPSQRLDLSHPCSPEEFERALLTAAGYENAPIPRSVYKPQWPKLRTLALGSTFHIGENADNLFQAAGLAALEMPELQIMEIWNECIENHHVFLYRRSDTEANGSPTITLSTAWDETPGPRVSIAWDRVAQKHSNRGIILKIKQLPRRDMHPYTKIIQLELREKILHPISLCEFRWYEESRKENTRNPFPRFLPW